MAYGGGPVDPVPGTVITVAAYVAAALNPIRALRAFTGNADPPGTGYMVTADSTTTTSWKTGVAAILSVLGYTPANKDGQVFGGAISVPSYLTVLAIDAIGNGGRINLKGGAGGIDAVLDHTASILTVSSPSNPTLGFSI